MAHKQGHVQISAGDLVFDADVAGDPADPLVLLLHGFPQTRHSWRHQLQPLADAGYFAVAPDQRGYSAGARPEGIDSYATQQIVNDALEIARAVGHERFHVVGHDWGGQISWLLAALHRDHVATLTVLSRPHPAAFARAMKDDSAQAGRSGHHRAFQDANMAAELLNDDARRLRRMLEDQHVPQADIEAYLSVLGDQAALDAALNWYRAALGGGSARSMDLPEVAVPVLYIWGDQDATVGRFAAQGTKDFVSGPYQFIELGGVGHFVTDQVREEVTQPLVRHLNADLFQSGG